MYLGHCGGDEYVRHFGHLRIALWMGISVYLVRKRTYVSFTVSTMYIRPLLELSRELNTISG